MKALLVSPRQPDTFWSFRHALPFVGKRSIGPPLGLLTVAGMLPPDWTCRLADLDVAPLQDRDILWADVVLASAMVVQRPSLLAVARRCRALGRPLVAGGPLFTPGAGDDPAYADIGTVVVGEAEGLMDRLVADLRAGRPARRYEARRFPDLARTPIPRWDLVDTRHYASLAVQFSRGCPFDCEFCDIVALNGRVPRLKTPARFIAELEAMRARGWDGPVFVVDDNFIAARRRVKDMLRALAAWRRRTATRQTYVTEASVDLARDPELMRLMVAAGFRKVFVGIETPDRDSLAACAKFQNTRGDLVADVRAIQAAGLEVMGGFIVGFDGDKPDICERQFDFIQRAGVVTAMVGLLQALPRSRLHERLRREGRLLGESLGDNTAGRFNFVPRLDGEYLVARYRELVRRLYEPEVYYGRIRRFLATYRRRDPAVRFGRAEVLALLRSLWVMGVRHGGRRAYWRFVASMLVRHRAQFGLAMTLAVYGHHFRTMARGL